MSKEAIFGKVIKQLKTELKEKNAFDWIKEIAPYIFLVFLINSVYMFYRETHITCNVGTEVYQRLCIPEGTYDSNIFCSDGQKLIGTKLIIKHGLLAKVYCND